METKIYMPRINPDINLDELHELLGLIKVSHRNYEILKQSDHERVYSIRRAFLWVIQLPSGAGKQGQ